VSTPAGSRSLAPGDTTTFTATVTGATDPTVTWTTSAGTIDQAGNYTAPQTLGSYTVTATSNEDPTSLDTATVTVSATPINVTATQSITDCASGPCTTLHRQITVQVSLDASLDPYGQIVIVGFAGAMQETSWVDGECQIGYGGLGSFTSTSPNLDPWRNGVAVFHEDANGRPDGAFVVLAFDGFNTPGAACPRQGGSATEEVFLPTRLVYAGDQLVGIDFDPGPFAVYAGEGWTYAGSGYVPLQ
jgi:hypothetical protein